MIQRIDIFCESLFLPDVKKIKMPMYVDDRGFFRETFRKDAYEACGIHGHFVQDNHSFSRKNVLRGMHFQRSPGQAKLVTIFHGTIFDVVVDIRKKSPTFMQWEGVVLDAAQGDQLFIPEGFAHGFCVLSEGAHVSYKVSTPYNPQEERGFRWDDPSINIRWPIKEPILSERDLANPLFTSL